MNFLFFVLANVKLYFKKNIKKKLPFDKEIGTKWGSGLVEVRFKSYQPPDGPM